MIKKKFRLFKKKKKSKTRLQKEIIKNNKAEVINFIISQKK